MAVDASTRYRTDWRVRTTVNGSVETYEQIGIILLQEIRDELKRLNGVIGCANFIAIPGTLRAIRKNTTKPRKVLTPEAPMTLIHFCGLELIVLTTGAPAVWLVVQAFLTWAAQPLRRHPIRSSSNDSKRHLHGGTGG